MPAMTPEQWQCVRNVVDRSLSLPVDEQQEFINSACGADTELRYQSFELLQNHRHVVEIGFLERSNQEPVCPENETPIRSDASTGTFCGTPPTVRDHGSDNDHSGAGRFEVIREHAQGGLGKVFVAKDCELDREVALKEIHHHHADDPNSQERFTREAEITGRLEHPGIVPVYGFGRHADGRPYYAMRMVKGQSLKDAIKEFHAKEGKDRDPGKRMLELRRLLGQFIEVCQTIHYAHSRGVIHRDIKPDNVLLGKYGETLVIDWGLAKTVGRPEQVGQETAEQETTLRPQTSQDGHATARGFALGTPAFMSPEQASGWLDKIGLESDVYSLGATLYCLLTGRPPVTGQDNDEIVDKARRADWQPAQAVNASVPQPLDAICRKAMSIEPGDRYKSARALADDIEHFLADEPVAAHTESWPERLARWSRNNRTWVRAGVAALVLVTTVSSVSAVWVNRERNAKAQLAQEKTELADKERTARVEAEESQQQEAEMRRRAEQIEKYLVSAFQSPDPKMGGREIKVADILDRERDRLRSELDDEPIVKARLLGAIGQSYLGLGLPAEAVEVLEESRKLCEENLGGNHRETVRSMGNLAHAYGSAGFPDKALQLFKKTLGIIREKLGEDNPNTLTANNNLAFAYRAVGEYKKAIPLFEKTLKITRTKLGEDHPYTLMFMDNLATAYLDNGEHDKAIPLMEQALDKMREELGDDHPDTLLTIGNLAMAYRKNREFDKAVPLAEQAMEKTRAKLGEAHPNTLLFMNNLAATYEAAGEPKKALPLYKQTLKKMAAKLGEDHPLTLTSMNNLALAYHKAGDLEKALPLFEQTLKKTRAKLGVDHPDTLMPMSNLAVAYRDTDRLDEALPLHEEAVRLARSNLGDKHPLTRIYISQYAISLAATGELKKAITLGEEIGFDYQVARWRKKLANPDGRPPKPDNSAP